jgi:hypothetical protein
MSAVMGGSVAYFIFRVVFTHQYLWKCEGYYFSHHPRGGRSAKLGNFFEVAKISAVYVRKSTVWVGLNCDLRTKFEWVWSDLTGSADKHSGNPMSERCEWGAGPTIGPEPDGSKMHA